MQLDREDLKTALARSTSTDATDLFGRVGAKNQVYIQIRQAIICGNLPPGTILTLRSISEAMDVSVMPVREAIQILIREGAVEQTTNKAFSIVRLNRAEFDEVKSVRLLLECTAIEAAAKKISRKALEHLHFYQSQMEALPLDNQTDYLVANHQFHFHIYHSSELSRLIPFIEMAWLQFAPNLSYFISQGAKQDGHQHHRDMIAALEERDGARAVKALREDIESAARVIQALID